MSVTKTRKRLQVGGGAGRGWTSDAEGRPASKCSQMCKFKAQGDIKSVEWTDLVARSGKQTRLKTETEPTCETKRKSKARSNQESAGLSRDVHSWGCESPEASLASAQLCCPVAKAANK